MNKNTVILFSIIFLFSCTNYRLKTFNSHDLKYLKNSPFFIDTTLRNNWNIEKKEKEYLKSQIQRSLLAGLLADLFYKKICDPKIYNFTHEFNPNYSVSFKSLPEYVKKRSTSNVKNPNLMYSQIISLFPHRNYEIPLSLDSISFPSVLSNLPDSSLFQVNDYIFYKVSIDKHELPFDTFMRYKSTISENYYYSDTKYGEIGYFGEKVRYYLSNLLVCVRKDFYYQYFKGIRAKNMFVPYRHAKNFDAGQHCMFLSHRFLQYNPSKTSLWLLLSNEGKIKSQNIYLSYFKIALYSDYQPKDFKIINDKGGVYQYTFYSKRYKQRAQLKFNADKPHVFDIKLLD